MSPNCGEVLLDNRATGYAESAFWETWPIQGGARYEESWDENGIVCIGYFIAWRHGCPTGNGRKLLRVLLGTLYPRAYRLGIC